jgi:PAS domain S-box-containing protein
MPRMKKKAGARNRRPLEAPRARKPARTRKVAELLEQREWFEVTLASIGDAVITTDVEGRVTFLNAVAQILTGWPSQEAVGKPLTEVFQIVNETTREKVENPVRKVLETGRIVGLANHTALIVRDGRVLLIEDSAAPIRAAGGKIAGVVMVFRDVTEVRRAQEVLRQEREAAEEVRNRLATLVESSDDAIISKTVDGVITTWNKAAENMFGYTAEEVVGRSIIVLFPPDRVDEEQAILARLRRGERIESYETVRVRKDGRKLNVSLTVSPIRDASGAVVGASKIARDITERKRADEALRESDRRKDEFLATLAHELRNPLAPIRQAALISKTPTASDAQKRWSHDVITRQVHHMALLLDDLLDISRITRGTLELRTEMTDLAAAIDAAVETARPAIDDKRHTFTVEMPPEPVYLAADPLRLAQVLSNLLTNAAKYTDPEGQIRLRAAATGDEVTIAVADTGIGLAPDEIGRLFEMFSQVKAAQDRSEGGLGIGLALARGLVHLHGGTIEVKSEGPGRGSEFIVHLPRRTVGAPRPGAELSTPRADAIRRRVLIADDNRDAADSLAMLLRLEGHEVTVVHDGREALAAFASQQPEIVLLDIGMPGLNGYQVARQIREGSLGRAVTLVAVTGWGQDTDKARALAAGFNHHYTKPIEPERLAELLRSDALR